MNNTLGKWLILAGAFLILSGLVVHFFHDKFQWIGRLPGDIRIEKENFRFYFPVTTMIIFSLLLTLIVTLAKKFFQGP